MRKYKAIKTTADDKDDKSSGRFLASRPADLKESSPLTPTTNNNQKRS